MNDPLATTGPWTVRGESGTDAEQATADRGTTSPYSVSPRASCSWGDSHLARVRRDLPALGPNVCNAAEGGASALDLLAQASKAAVEEDDLVVVSVGTNDAAPWKQVSVMEFAQALSRCMQSVPARGWAYVAPPGVDESRLTGAGDRTNAVLDEYRDAAVFACNDVGAKVVRTERVILPLGAGAFVSDGLHLSGRAYQVVLAAIAEAIHATA